MDLNFTELNKNWEETFYDGDWEPDSMEYTKTEERIIGELKSFLPRHMHYYDWNLPYADEILLIFRRHLITPNKSLGIKPLRKPSRRL